jgi:hypothetical protein
MPIVAIQSQRPAANRQKPPPIWRGDCCGRRRTVAANIVGVRSSKMSDFIDEVEIGFGGLPVGNYRSKLAAVTKETTVHGLALKFVFEVTEGPATGQRSSRMVSATPTAANNAGKLITMLTGNSVAGGQKVRLSECIGRAFVIEVVETKSGSTRVEKVIRI